MRGLTILALVLIVVGALNWGLIGIFGFNLVAWVFGGSTIGVAVQRIVYTIVGLAGVYGLLMLSRLVSHRDDVCVPGHAQTSATLS
jgi:uncharacterized membrane protein YuzA (DUF378 family)